MLKQLTKKLFGTRNERDLKDIQPLVAQINRLDAEFAGLSDDELKGWTGRLKERLASGENVDSILPHAFAVVREAGKRVLGMRHFDCQLVGGIVLHRGRIAEMKTGEGKTLVATLPTYLNALTGRGVHVITVNDYLAKRDSEWMGKLYRFLGLSVGVILHGLNDQQRQVGYRSDITYGTNNEFGFDYLRDNMKFNVEQFTQRELHYAIVDEVDSILIDEARTPLIISGPGEKSTQLYYTVNQIIPMLKKERDYTVDEKAKSVMLTEEGVAHTEKLLKCENLYDPRNIELLHHTNQALRAHVMYKRDVEYVVKDGEVVIVDEFTGRLMPGRRWSDGLHQAVEAKEGVRIESENQTLATVTFQNYFRMYEKLSGMTGTADTEAPEFAKIYNLDVVVIPTNMPAARKDFADLIYKTEEAKFNAIVENIKESNKKGQPVLVGTVAIETSERLSKAVSRHGIKASVLNAKYHEKEAEIIAQAGRKGAVTIATNMAGRGVDIILGGNPEALARKSAGAEATEEEYQKLLGQYKEQCRLEREEVLASGGLFILGTERHESRRIDNQLRGRAGRQGDPGASRFYLSLEDNLLRIFGGERMFAIMDKLGMEENDAIEHPWLTRAIENAQKRVEEHNFSIRKNLLEYDDVMNQQRKTVYGLRRQFLTSSDCKDYVLNTIDERVTAIVDTYFPQKRQDGELDLASFEEQVVKQFNLRFDTTHFLGSDLTADHVGKLLYDQVVALYEAKEEEYGPPILRQIERYILLQNLDNLWKDHLLQMDHLKEGIGLRGYGQKDPLMEYKKEGFALFQSAISQFMRDIIEQLMRVQVERKETAPEELELSQKETPPTIQLSHREVNPFGKGPMQDAGSPPPKGGTVKHEEAKVGRNDPCPCGSGKKYKKCCGQ